MLRFYKRRKIIDFCGVLNMVNSDHKQSADSPLLRHLRDAAKPTTQLIVVDNIMAYACEDPSVAAIPGATLPLPPAPLLPNLGEANSSPYLLDIHVSNFPRQTIDAVGG